MGNRILSKFRGKKLKLLELKLNDIYSVKRNNGGSGGIFQSENIYPSHEGERFIYCRTWQSYIHIYKLQLNFVEKTCVEDKVHKQYAKVSLRNILFLYQHNNFNWQTSSTITSNATSTSSSSSLTSSLLSTSLTSQLSLATSLLRLYNKYTGGDV
ncbi:hypothetical protein FF38_07710 [Lucilia cuprina]|uniref:Uncharacterized protein n=1 Tax=Lucilia cuprina TaxID=7375 RepID=A0A0L0BKX8_LUCCU|nr:hypothetical protein FF38_07710 [Lucilia cuprina]